MEKIMHVQLRYSKFHISKFYDFPGLVERGREELESVTKWAVKEASAPFPFPFVIFRAP